MSEDTQPAPHSPTEPGYDVDAEAPGPSLRATVSDAGDLQALAERLGAELAAPVAESAGPVEVTIDVSVARVETDGGRAFRRGMKDGATAMDVEIKDGMVELDAVVDGVAVYSATVPAEPELALPAFKALGKIWTRALWSDEPDEREGFR